MVEAVLFDLDGTLIDSESYYVGETDRWLKMNGCEADIAVVAKIIGLTMEDTYAYMSALTGMAYDEVKESYDRHFRENSLDFRKLLFPDVRKTFAELKRRGIRIAICSLSESGYVKNAMKECGIAGDIDYYVGGDEVKRPKPYPDIYLKALEVLNLDRKNVIVVEDAQAGIEAAKRASLHVLARDASRLHVDQSRADAIIEDLYELIGAIDRYE